MQNIFAQKTSAFRCDFFSIATYRYTLTVSFECLQTFSINNQKISCGFLFVKIQNILIRNVWKTQKFAISLSIRTFKILKVTRILGQISFMVHFKKRRYKRHSFLTNFLKLTESYRIKVYSINMKFQEKIFTIVKVIQL